VYQNAMMNGQASLERFPRSTLSDLTDSAALSCDDDRHAYEK